MVFEAEFSCDGPEVLLEPEPCENLLPSFRFARLDEQCFGEIKRLFSTVPIVCYNQLASSLSLDSFDERRAECVEEFCEPAREELPLFASIYLSLLLIPFDPFARHERATPPSPPPPRPNPSPSAEHNFCRTGKQT